MKTNYCLRACACCAIIIGLAVANGAYAQVGTINSAIVTPRVDNGIPGATFTGVNNYPSVISFSEQGVSATSGFANRDVWQFSNNGGTSAYQFQNNDFFQVSMEVTLTGNTISPRREAGFLFTTIGGDGQFIVDTDNHEVVAGGGPLPFYAFPATFNSGDTITLGMTYFLDGSGNRAIIYTANGVNSPTLELSSLEQGMINNSTLGGYFQIRNASSDPSNSGLAVFQNISISPPVPEPSVIALLSLGILPFLLRRRRI